MKKCIPVKEEALCGLGMPSKNSIRTFAQNGRGESKPRVVPGIFGGVVAQENLEKIFHG